MVEGSGKKLKAFYVMRYLLTESDEAHPVTMEQIIDYLGENGISAERKSLYDDIEALRVFGLDIIGEKVGRSYHYYIGARDFELAELKLLVDSVQSSRFITVKKTRELIKKLEVLAGRHNARQLQRQVYVAERIKAMNESIYYNVDALHMAIANNVRIHFQYFQWTVQGREELRHDGKVYEISPWALSWTDENYYLIGYDGEAGIIKHFRVDKMLKISQTELLREGRDRFEKFDMAVYARKMFGMYDGEEQVVKLAVKRELVGVMIDRFGREISFLPAGDGWYQVSVRVAVSGQFYGWVMALGAGAKIVGPGHVVEGMRKEIHRLNEQYGMG
ncbi:MAG: WYL domain-containing protein [Lachnospiraceae bacterium]|nr:WYL domain-containing protein [Lachnospiraceae bacterium]